MTATVREVIDLPDAQLTYWPQFLCASTSDRIFADLHTTLAWQQDYITLFGQTHKVPRLQVWMGDSDAHYQYSGLALSPQPWSPTVQAIKQSIEKRCHHHFNSVLINLYRDGQDSNGWHSDDEPELGDNPVIASLSLGATRRFRLRHKYQKAQAPCSLDLSHGSLLLMAGTTQQYWQHCLTKTTRRVGPRINLTFRWVEVR